MDNLGIITVLLMHCTVKQFLCQLILPSFHWNHRNTIFEANNPKEQKKLCRGPAHIYVDYGSEFYFICPNSMLDVAKSESRLNKYDLFENIHMVNEKGFNECRIDRRDSLLLKCDQSMKIRSLKFELIMFHRMNWNGWSFKPNNTYYFINTSNGTRRGLGRRSGGRCHSHNMKLKVTVCHPEQKCSQCKGLCCEKPPTTKPPTTTATTTKKAVPTTHAITTTKVKPVRSASGAKSSSPRHVLTKNADTEREQETETKELQKSKSKARPTNSPQAVTTAPKSVVEQSGPRVHNCSGDVQSSNQIGGYLKGADSSGTNWLYIFLAFASGVVLSAVVVIVVWKRATCRRRKSSSNESKNDSSQEAQMLPKKQNHLEVVQGINRLQSVSSSDSGYQDPIHV